MWHQTNYRFRRYGLTSESYEAMWAAQGNCCALCKTDAPGRGYIWNIDHCHSTGRVRGILCHSCNTGLGYHEKLMASPGESIIRAYLAAKPPEPAV